MKPGVWIDRIDNGIYAVEKFIVALFFIVMVVVVAADVTHRTFSSPESRLAGPWIAMGVSPERAHGVAGPLTVAFLAVLLFYGGLRERWRDHAGPGKMLLGAVALTGFSAGAIQLFLYLFPNGLIWSQPLALSLMLWVGILGASMAAKQRRHLSLEFGTKIWPASMKKHVRVAAGVLVAGFCAFLAYQAWGLIAEVYKDFDPEYGMGMMSGVPIPRFMVYGILPYGFFMVVIRYFRGQLADDTSGGIDHLLQTQKQEQEPAS
jgi:TRAP-type C4-dicarboxylate transport system permease small subunit